MKGTVGVLRAGLGQIMRDGVLLLLLLAPFLMGAALFLSLPLADSLLQERMGMPLSPWFLFSDMFLVSMAPIMIAMLAAFVLLEERDEGLGLYHLITPAGRHTYLTARVGVPMVWALFSTLVVVWRFALSLSDHRIILLASIIATLQATMSCMLLAALANNKVEGLALAKMTNLLILGLPVSWFVQSPWKYTAGFLPSFWLGELGQRAGGNGSALGTAVFFGILSAGLWILLAYRLFLRRSF